MIWNRLSVFATLFPNAAQSAAQVAARRWREAVRADPELAKDLIKLGGVLALQPPGPDATTLAYEAGRRDFALQLLAMMNLTHSEMLRYLGDYDND